MVKSVTSVLFELAGLATAAYGLWTLASWLGITLAGAGLFYVGTAIDPPKRSGS